MATTVRTSKLRLTVTENLTLNGTEHGSKSVISVDGINEVSKRVLTAATDPGTQIYSGSIASTNSTFKTDDVLYIRAKNLDDTNFITLHIEGNSHYSQLKLKPGNVFFLTSISGSFDNASEVSDFSPENITRIDAMADTNDCDVEILVASK